MGDRSAIEWTEASWNPLVGCSRVSEGCRHCYAERQAFRAAAMGISRYDGITKKVGEEIRWTGEVRLVESALDLPLRWKAPRRIFVNSMSDLFHEKVADEWIDQIFAVMVLTARRSSDASGPHTFQILTKRPERMRDYIGRSEENVWRAGERLVYERDEVAPAGIRFGSAFRPDRFWRWPLEGVWLGVSVEDQATADARIPLLLQTPAAVRFLSYEPALGPIRLLNADGDGPRGGIRGALHWGIYGGESGPGARRGNIAWARRFIRECRAAKIAPYIKQLGAFVVDRNDADFTGWDDGDGWPDGTKIEEHINGYSEDYQGAPVRVKLRDRKGGDPSEWPEDLRVREFPRGRAGAPPRGAADGQGQDEPAGGDRGRRPVGLPPGGPGAESDRSLLRPLVRHGPNEGQARRDLAPGSVVRGDVRAGNPKRTARRTGLS